MIKLIVKIAGNPDFYQFYWSINLLFMVDPNELWIGDKLRIPGSGREGTYEGTKVDGRLRVRVGDKILLVRSSNVEKIDEKNLEKTKKEVVIEKLELKLKNKKVGKSIDLHIEILRPDQKHGKPERILDIQLEAFEDYIKNVRKLHLNPVTIIHGKGTGVLKESIHSRLSSTDFVSHFHLINNDGATEVYFKY